MFFVGSVGILALAEREKYIWVEVIFIWWYAKSDIEGFLRTVLDLAFIQMTVAKRVHTFEHVWTMYRGGIVILVVQGRGWDNYEIFSADENFDWHILGN